MFALTVFVSHLEVFMIRATSFPILLAIAVYERQKYHPVPLDERIERWFDRNVGTWPRRLWNGGVSGAVCWTDVTSYLPLATS
jgi:hypothetical protein